MYGTLSRNTEAALEGIARSLPREDIDAALLPIPLSKIGDAIRLGLDIPGPLRRWSEGLGHQSLDAACGAVQAELAVWSLPAREAVDVGDPVLVHVLSRRDEVESFLCAIDRIAWKAGTDTAATDGKNALRRAIAIFDGALSDLFSQEQVLSMLGVRAQLQKSQSWTSKLRDERVEPLADSNEQMSPIGVLALPAEELVMKYLATGNLAGYVEACADRDEEFAEGLQATIDLMRRTGEGLGLAARRWQRARDRGAGTGETGIRFEVSPRRATAATSIEDRTEAQHVDLGWLHPLGVTAAIQVTGASVEISVFADDPRQIAVVEFGEGLVRAPDDQGTWVARTQRTSASIHLRVQMSDGRVFSEDLIFSAPAGS